MNLPAGISPDVVLANLKVAREKRDRLYREFEAAAAEVEWWEHGARLFKLETSREVEADRVISEMLPNMEERPLKPTLRQAILLMLRADPNGLWNVDGISEMLRLNGWLPGTEPSKRISDMAGVMVTERILQREGRGEYRLDDDLAAALIRKLPRSPIIEELKSLGSASPTICRAGDWRTTQLERARGSARPGGCSHGKGGPRAVHTSARSPVTQSY